MPEPEIPETGRSFGTDLYAMNWAGRERLPYIADRLLTANNLVAATGDTDATAFRQNTGQSPVRPHWNALRDFLQESLAGNGNRLRAVGEALVMCAEEYAARDTENRDSLVEAAGRLAGITDHTAGFDGNGAGIPAAVLPGAEED